MKGNGIETDNLDGVIRDLEKVRDTWQNQRNGLEYPTLRDTLHYLKEYRGYQQAYEYETRKAEEARELYIKAVQDCEKAEKIYRIELHKLMAKSIKGDTYEFD